jgi:hypothetical protein
VLTELLDIPFAPSLSTIQVYSIPSSILGALTVSLLTGACLSIIGRSYFINVSSAASGCSSES